MLIFEVHILSPVFGLLTNVTMQLAGCRYAKEWGLLRSILMGFLSGYVTVLTIEVVHGLAAKLALLEFIGQITLSTISYVALGYGYFHFINLGETARRVRILIELWESDGGLSMNELLERYNASDIINVRLQRMMNNKQIVLQNGRYYIGRPIMLFMAKAMVMMKLIFLKRRSEFQ